jgi:hypothetical protein
VQRELLLPASSLLIGSDHPTSAAGPLQQNTPHGYPTGPSNGYVITCRDLPNFVAKSITSTYAAAWLSRKPRARSIERCRFGELINFHLELINPVGGAARPAQTRTRLRSAPPPSLAVTSSGLILGAARTPTSTARTLIFSFADVSLQRHQNKCVGCSCFVTHWPSPPTWPTQCVVVAACRSTRPAPLMTSPSSAPQCLFWTSCEPVAQVFHLDPSLSSPTGRVLPALLIGAHRPLPGALPSRPPRRVASEWTADPARRVTTASWLRGHLCASPM